jgi:hypothetical protein
MYFTRKYTLTPSFLPSFLPPSIPSFLQALRQITTEGHNASGSQSPLGPPNSALPEPPRDTPAVVGSVTTELAKLAEMKAAGVLDDGEFKLAKQRVLQA